MNCLDFTNFGARIADYFEYTASDSNFSVILKDIAECFAPSGHAIAPGI